MDTYKLMRRRKIKLKSKALATFTPLLATTGRSLSVGEDADATRAGGGL